MGRPGSLPGASKTYSKASKARPERRREREDDSRDQVQRRHESAQERDQDREDREQRQRHDQRRVAARGRARVGLLRGRAADECGGIGAPRGCAEARDARRRTRRRTGPSRSETASRVELAVVALAAGPDRGHERDLAERRGRGFGPRRRDEDVGGRALARPERRPRARPGRRSPRPRRGDRRPATGPADRRRRCRGPPRASAPVVAAATTRGRRATIAPTRRHSGLPPSPRSPAAARPARRSGGRGSRGGRGAASGPRAR